MRGGERFFCLLALLLPAFAVRAEQSNVYIASITIHRTNVFDPEKEGENKPPYTWANKLHIVTRERVIRRELLLGPGDLYDPYLAAQSERNLRAYKFIKEATITKRRQGNELHLDVYTQDTWTTDIAPSLGRSGGKNNYGALLRERNFLGRGKTLELSYDDQFNKVGRTVVYKDPRLARTRWALNLSHTDYSDGFDGVARLELPLYSLLTPYYYGLHTRHASIPEPLYERGDEIGRFQENLRSYEFYAGRSLLATTHHAIRSAAGWRAQKEVYTTTSPPQGLGIPENRDRHQATWTIEYAQSDFIAENYVNEFDSVEDFNLGWGASLGAAYGSRSLGSDHEEYSPRVGAQKGLSLGDGHFLIFYGDMMGDWIKNQGFSQVIQSVNANYTRKYFMHPKNTLVAQAEAAQGLRLHPDTRLMLGGNAGLRGYRLNAFNGTRSMLFNVESRWHAVDDFLKVTSIAPVIFWDAGYVWPATRKSNLSDLKHDIGLGLRIGFPRSATNPTLRLDLSYALNSEGASNSRWLFSFNTNYAFGARGNALPSGLRPIERPFN